MQPKEIIDHVRLIRYRMKQACLKANRAPDAVKLLLATKTVSPENIKVALNAGEHLIGENKVQELKEKFDLLKNTKHEKHFIGHLQTNKIKEILKYQVSCIQSLDRLDLAKKLDQRLNIEQKKIDVFIQVNTSGEASKFGVSPENAVTFIKQVSQFDTLQIKGLMTIGLFDADQEKIRLCFRRLKNIQQEILHLNLAHTHVQELSMGMSGDLEIAIEEGATIVRVGSAIFGQRVYPDQYYWNESKS